ncbi:DNA-binding protein inhibitor ID-1 [Myotis brandtii]|uniref:DNA-binding protein inhibitor ID-1 n=1 Tax=Myotis brandtii TaxID=109478 RepID=S7NHX3_MYOBR|nr:DNA-binding protein inhibitor ID-1 [Myotis brandtii]
MNGCYSRLKELVPTLPQNRKVSRVEILQHVIDYIWDLQLELNSESQVGTPGARGLPARAPLSTLNGEISALAAEVRSELEPQIVLFLQMGKLSPGEGGGTGPSADPILSGGVCPGGRPHLVSLKRVLQTPPTPALQGREERVLSGPPERLPQLGRNRTDQRPSGACGSSPGLGD